MIIEEKIIINERELIKTYSDAGKYIIQTDTGIRYEEAIDIPNKYSYSESEEDLPREDNSNMIV